MTTVTLSCVLLCLCVALIQGQATPITVPSGALSATSTNSDPSLNTLANAYDSDVTTCAATSPAENNVPATMTYNLGALYTINTVVLKTEEKPAGTQTLTKMDAVKIVVTTAPTDGTSTSCAMSTTFSGNTGTGAFTCTASGAVGQYVIISQTSPGSIVTICNTIINGVALTTMTNTQMTTIVTTTITNTPKTTILTTTKVAILISKKGIVVKYARLDLLTMMVLTITAVSRRFY